MEQQSCRFLSRCFILPVRIKYLVIIAGYFGLPSWSISFILEISHFPNFPLKRQCEHKKKKEKKKLTMAYAVIFHVVS